MTKAVLSRNILFNWFWIAASISLSNALVASSRIRIGAFFNKTLAKIKKHQPDKIILIDYPGFNLRLAKKLKALNFDVTYFILPQVWAWKESRTKILQQCCKKLISIIVKFQGKS